MLAMQPANSGYKLAMQSFADCHVSIQIIQHRFYYVTKDELRAELERQAQRFTNIYGGEITTYAAEREPERKPWRKKPTVLDQVFQQEVQKLEQAKRADGDGAITPPA